MSNFSDNNDFQTILNRLLSRIPDTLDKRQGSIIYDALAPAAAELSQCYISLDVYKDQTNLENATSENLDNRVADFGVTRNSPTFAQRIGEFKNTNNEPMEIELNTKFGIPNIEGGYTYMVTSEIELGKYVLICETAGTVGNEYFGELLPVTSVNDLGEAKLTGIYIAGEDEESDESLRGRTIDKLRETPFGGNIAEYKQYVEDIDGIGACMVIPIWNGGGTVKIVPVTNSYDIPSSAKINEIQTLLDPTQNSGQGIGIAPIGHIVTVSAPNKLTINVSADIQIDSTHSLSGLEESIKQSIGNYINEVQMNWSDAESLTIYTSRLLASILSVKGVVNAENLKINNSSSNLTIYPKTDDNDFPMLGEVVLNET